MSALSAERRSAILTDFLGLLKSRWTFQVACQNECEPDDACDCIRRVIHVSAVTAWWKSMTPDLAKQNRLWLLLDDSKLIQPHSSDFKESRSSGNYAHILVFSMLLEQGRGHLLGRFVDSDIDDRSLANMTDGSEQRLRKLLAESHSSTQVDQVMDDFHGARWAYCPLSLTLHMDQNLQGSKIIPPFCHKIRLGHAGGTASLYWIAVQRDLISDNALAFALRDSLYTDETYGECYQMALKSYTGNRRREFEMEKEAFSSLRSSDGIPILQYLGSYTHDYGEGTNQGGTYNLLLEYGESDLYQAWADETNVPPVQAQEILQCWKSLFNIAEAIRHVHHIEIPRAKGEPRKLNGWHADIKPNNILSVRGRLKLADFGFFIYAPVVEGRDNSAPTEIIRGYTDTYGAPEVTRMVRPDGTLSSVSQAIDAWSFGCVLSVAATWVVLGFQGLRQYERLRQLSPANSMNGPGLDRFHDGYQVLPEVGKWHDYLRGHLRPSDTTTELVLGLIENKLLRAEPVARHSLEELCEKLQELSDWAQYKIKSLRNHSRDTDPVVMRALSSIEEEAHIQRASERNLTQSQQSFVPTNPRQRASMRTDMGSMIKDKPLGQTTYRKEILEEKLGLYYDREVDKTPLLADESHNGDLTESPTEATLPNDMPFAGCRSKPKNPQFRAHEQEQLDASIRTLSGTRLFSESDRPATPPPSSDRYIKVSSPDTGPYSDDVFTTQPNGSPFDINPSAKDHPAGLNLRIARTVSPSAGHSIDLAHPSRISNLLSPFPETGYAMQNSDHLAEKEAYAAEFPPSGTIHGSIERDVESGNASPLRNPVHLQSHKAKAAAVSDMSHTKSLFDDRHKHRYELKAENASLVEAVGNPGPSIRLSQAEDTQSAQQPSSSASVTHTHQKEALRIHAPSQSYDDSPRPLPPSALDLPYDICVTRKDIDYQVSKGIAKRFAKVKGKFGIETRARAPSLKDTFSDSREIIFIIDNGWTMAKHWPIVTFVAQTLAKKAAGLDRSGFDVKFTVDGHAHNENHVKGDAGRGRLQKALRKAWPEYKPANHATTDMAKVFRDVYHEWDRVGQPATTLLVLTDGVWSETDLRTLNMTILDIARRDQRNAGNRYFSIQFIRFGDEAAEKARLQWLEDHLCAENNLRDIVDHCSWRSTVDKMLMGSIEGYWDYQEPEEPPILYDYDDLVGLFNAFNRGYDGESGHLKRLSQTPLRGSIRSSVSTSRADSWMERR